MSNKTTYILAACTFVILAAAIGIGAFVTQPKSNPEPQPTIKQPTKTVELAPTKDQLDERLDKELPALSAALTAAYPTIPNEYIIDRGKLYGNGEWYGTTLTYKGADVDNRDTLRVLMQKKDNIWVVRSTPPKPLLSSKVFTDVPKKILNDINQPAPLPGTASSPAITPSE